MTALRIILLATLGWLPLQQVAAASDVADADMQRDAPRLQALLKKAHEPGRVAVQEIMICNAAIRNLIRENKLFQIPSMMQAGKAEGQQLMEVAAKELALQKKITREDAIRLSNNPKLFDDVMPPRPQGLAQR